MIIDFFTIPEGTGCIKVTDTGPGIPEEMWETIFEPYVRLSAEGQKKEGAGIGLAIVRQLVESMNGTISVNSTMDQGSEFTVTLPLAT